MSSDIITTFPSKELLLLFLLRQFCSQQFPSVCFLTVCISSLLLKDNFAGYRVLSSFRCCFPLPL